MVKAAFLLLCIVAAVHSTPVALTLRERQILLETDIETRQSPSPDYRLDGHVVPSHYEIWLRPYFTAEGDKAAFTFDGSVKITVRATRSNQVNIVLHANRLTVANDWRVYDLLDPSIVIPHPDYEYDAVTHKLTLHLNRVLQPERDYVIEMTYVGVMADDMAGFYRSYYKDNGVKK
jgi:aminopeptidase N